MRTFITLWFGQLASSLGSSMTYFALTLWIWQQTQSATAIALILVFYQLPQLAISLFSGILIDRIPRKRLLWLSDAGAACCTISVGILAGLQILQIWHIYLIATVIGGFGNIQALAYTTLVPLIVPPQHHTRASSLGSMVEYGAAILSPALAGLLYPTAGLLGITAIDMTTFMMAMVTLALVKIPAVKRRIGTGEWGVENREQGGDKAGGGQKIWHDITFGFRYIASHHDLLAMVIALSTFTFLHQIGETLYQPMILAQTGGDAQVLGLVVAASGIGGVVGAIAFSLWGGFQQRQVGLFSGFIGTGLSQLLLGLSRLPSLWGVARFGMSFHNPLIMSSYMAVWYAKVSPDLQGRVLSADYLVGTVMMLTANLVAGPLADQVFEPWMQHHESVFSAILGQGVGSGIALLQGVLASGILILGGVGLVEYRYQRAPRAER
ncbi:MAG: MFS transporter [Leptolyngbya sp. SIO4C5]|nr:MFS transporter [Leptolyngbya sp. SIO4C5]